jgi:hypothetical protein
VWDRWLAILWQLSLILFLDQLYEVGRSLIPSHPERAMGNAVRIIRWEEGHKLFREPSIQHFWLSDHTLGWFQLSPRVVIDVLNFYYLYGHFLGTAVFLIWLYFRRQSAFRFVRDLIFVSTGIAFVIYIVFPTAPPRLVPAHTLFLLAGIRFQFVDTLGPWVNSHGQAMQDAYNPYAAMPSLHFVWALIVGSTLAVAGRRPLLRLLGPLYTTLMLATIVISANHFILDAVGSVIVVAIAATGLWLVEGVASGRLHFNPATDLSLPSPL